MKIDINSVKIDDTRRAINFEIVDKLAESIKEVGLLNPITIDEGYRLIAGAHRIAAARKLGWDEIPCVMVDMEDLKAKLAEIDENLIRNEGSMIERGEWLAEKKKIYEQLHPETRQTNRGGAFKGNQYKSVVSEINSLTNPKDVSPKLSFVQDTSEKTGLSKRTIEQEIQIAENLTPEVKEFAKEVGITKTKALKLSRLPAHKQNEIVEPIKNIIKTIPKEGRKENAKRLLEKEFSEDKIKQDPVMKEIDRVYNVYSAYQKAVYTPSHLEIKDEHLIILMQMLEKENDVQYMLDSVNAAIAKLEIIKGYITKNKKESRS